MSESQQSLWRVEARQALRLKMDSGPRELQVVEGQLWLTVSAASAHASQDIWLQPGQRLALARGSEIVIEAWKAPAGFQLLVPPSACPQLLRQLQGLRSVAGASWTLAAAPAC